MNDLEKIEFVCKGQVSELNKQIERAKASGNNPGSIYVYGLESQITALMRMLGDIDAIKRKDPNMTEDNIAKLFPEN